MTVFRPIAGYFAALIVVLAASLSLQAQTIPTTCPPVGPLTVEEAVNFAMTHNPTLTNALQNVQIAQTQVGVARSNRLPNASINANLVYTPSPSAATIPGSTVSIPLTVAVASTAQASITQPVWPPTRWTAPISAAQAGVGQSQAALVRTQQTVAFQTRQAFYQLLDAQELLKVAQLALDVTRSQLTLAENTVKAGIAAPLDEFQASATEASSEVNLERAQNNVNLAEGSLAVQLGLPASTPITITPPETMPVAPDDATALTQLALHSRPELQGLNCRRAQLRADIQITRLEQLPIVNIGAAYVRPLTGESVFVTSGLTFTAGLAFDVYNGGRTHYEIEGLRIQLAQVDTTEKQTELGITLDVRAAVENLQNANKQLNAAQRQYVAAAEARRIAQIRYENGEGILLEADQARLNEITALTSLAQARDQALQAAAQLEYAVGAQIPLVKQRPAITLPLLPTTTSVPATSTTTAPATTTPAPATTATPAAPTTAPAASTAPAVPTTPASTSPATPAAPASTATPGNQPQ